MNVYVNIHAYVLCLDMTCRISASPDEIIRAAKRMRSNRATGTDDVSVIRVI